MRSIMRPVVGSPNPMSTVLLPIGWISPPSIEAAPNNRDGVYRRPPLPGPGTIPPLPVLEHGVIAVNGKQIERLAATSGPEHRVDCDALEYPGRRVPSEQRVWEGWQYEEVRVLVGRSQQGGALQPLPIRVQFANGQAPDEVLGEEGGGCFSSMARISSTIDHPMVDSLATASMTCTRP